MVATFNFTLEEYSSDEVDFTYAGDLTGCSLRWFMQYNVRSSMPLVEKTTANGVTIKSTSPTQSIFSVSLSNQDMAPIGPGTYYHQATMTDALGNENPIVHGSVTVDAESNN